MTTNSHNNIILKIEKLKKFFPVKGSIFSRLKKFVKAVNSVSFEIKKGETFGLVGESGCGKTTLGRTVIKLLRPTSGSIFFDGLNLVTCKNEKLRQLRKNMQIIFQDPNSSLNPRLTILDIVTEGLIEHKVIKKNDRKSIAAELLKKVGLSPDYIYRYPHEFSGGQRQRINIARAISLNPKFIVCDEVVSALDVSIQAQILDLLMKLKEEMNLSYLFISHDLPVVKYISDRMAVMYLGKIVELGTSEEVFNNPFHPYTKSLIKSIPEPNPFKKTNDKFYQNALKGEVPSMINLPTGCPFNTRCPEAFNKCFINDVFDYRINHHFVKCNLYKK